MGVYIKGLNMPTVGRILITLPSGRTLEVSADNTQNILGEAKAVPVPPHGRVIDADALHYSRIRIVHNDGTVGGYHAVVMSAEIKDAPTIIPAEEGET